jgi:hypothetical protein
MIRSPYDVLIFLETDTEITVFNGVFGRPTPQSKYIQLQTLRDPNKYKIKEVTLDKTTYYKMEEIEKLQSLLSKIKDAKVP